LTRSSPKKAKKIKQQKQTKARQKVRVMEQAHPKAQDSVFYTSQHEEGFMHIVENEYSQMYRLGEVDYEVATEAEQTDCVMGYAEGLNSLDKNSRYQLVVLNRRVKSSVIEDACLPYQGDEYDNLREEMNQVITQTQKRDQRNFVVDKYAIFTTESKNKQYAKRVLDSTAENFKNRFESNEVDLQLTYLSGVERLKVMANMMQPDRYFSTTYQDIELSGLPSKAFVAPTTFRFPKNKTYFRMGDNYARVLYIRDYPKYLEDRLIRELCGSGVELAISIHATPYNMTEAKKRIRTVNTLNNVAKQKQQKENFKQGLSEDMISGEVKEIGESAESLMDEIKENGQKMFSGIFTVLLVSDTEEELDHDTKVVKEDVGDTWEVTFETVDAYKEEALNTILPIGKPYLDVERNYLRDMTTSNVASQVPFTNVELQSPTGQYYGRNQITHGLITIDRQKDLITPSGLILGSSGSGKGMTTKSEMTNTILSKIKQNREKGETLKDRIIIVDPESEYLPLGRKFDAEILEISTGTKHHLNILDLADYDLLDKEDRTVDLVKEKANLLASLFESLLKEFTDMEASIVDRVTRLTYARFENLNDVPTLVDWEAVLREQPEVEAQILATKIEPYTTGSQDIFAHKTNVDLSSPFVIFNIKKLDDRLKPFAMKVILDQIWKQVVAGQGKVTTYLYFDEIQLNFDTEENANWFMKLWSRVRKYGSIPTGITQNVATLLDTASGKKMISNSEFIILLRQKMGDIRRLQEVMKLSPKQMKYINEKAPQGTGLIYAGGTIVPFENPIPKNTELFDLMNTDAA
jgi:hypothetical protein